MILSPEGLAPPVTSESMTSVASPSTPPPILSVSETPAAKSTSTASSPPPVMSPDTLSASSAAPSPMLSMPRPTKRWVSSVCRPSSKNRVPAPNLIVSQPRRLAAVSLPELCPAKSRTSTEPSVAPASVPPSRTASKSKPPFANRILSAPPPRETLPATAAPDATLTRALPTPSRMAVAPEAPTEAPGASPISTAPGASIPIAAPAAPPVTAPDTETVTAPALPLSTLIP